MKAVLEMEFIGENYFAAIRAKKKGVNVPSGYMARWERILGRHDHKPPWVACLTGLCDKFGFKRKFQTYYKDYSRANSTGSRGIYIYFALDPGVYEIHERTTWKRTRRYFVRVENMQIAEITREKAIRCLANAA